MTNCSFCKGTVGAALKFKLIDGSMCLDCFTRFNKISNGRLSKMSSTFGKLSKYRVADIHAILDEYKTRHPDDYFSRFAITRTINSFVDFDDDAKLIFVRGGLSMLGNPQSTNSTYLTYQEVIDCEIFEDGVSVTNTGLEGAIVGGALFGATGAIVGTIAGKKTTDEVYNISVSIVTSNPNRTRIIVPVMKMQTTRGSTTYKSAIQNAREILAAFTQIVKNNLHEQQMSIFSNSSSSHSSELSSADELRKFKHLLDDGIITQKEFDAKKKQLLGINES